MRRESSEKTFEGVQYEKQAGDAVDVWGGGVGPGWARAATITVNSTNDPAGFNPAITIGGLGATVTLRDAVNAANNTAGDDAIVLDASLNGLTIGTSQGTLSISSNLTIGAQALAGPM